MACLTEPEFGTTTPVCFSTLRSFPNVIEMETYAACGRTMTDFFGFVTETWIVVAHFTIPCATARATSEHKGECFLLVLRFFDGKTKNIFE